MMYLGTLGRMISIKCPTRQRVVPTERYSFTQTMGGRVKAQSSPAFRRSWEISTGQLTTPSDVADIMDFVSGAWGAGPFWFVPTDAPVVNVLPPEATRRVRDSYYNAGPLRLDSGRWAPFSVSATGGPAGTIWVTDSESDVPVIPGVPVTGSAWLTGYDTALSLFWLDATGRIFRQSESDRVTSPVVGERVSVTMTPPADAVAVRLVGVNTIRLARPAITYTSEVFPWGDGQGCPKAVVHSSSREVTKAWDNPHTGRWSDLSFTVQEVG